MTNVERALKALYKAGYTARLIAGNTIQVDDVVHCRSGAKTWVEVKKVTLNVSMNLSQVERFIDQRS